MSWFLVQDSKTLVRKRCFASLASLLSLMLAQEGGLCRQSCKIEIVFTGISRQPYGFSSTFKEKQTVVRLNWMAVLKKITATYCSLVTFQLVKKRLHGNISFLPWSTTSSVITHWKQRYKSQYS